MKTFDIKNLQCIEGKAFGVLHLINESYSLLIEEYVYDNIEEEILDSETKIFEYLIENMISNIPSIYMNTNFWTDTMIKLYNKKKNITLKNILTYNIV